MRTAAKRDASFVLLPSRQVTRRQALRYFSVVPTLTAAERNLPGQSRPDSFKIYTEGPRLLLRPQRIRLLRRERERRSLRWDQFETLWTAGLTTIGA